MKKRMISGVCMGMTLLVLAGCGGGRMADSTAAMATMAASTEQYDTEMNGAGIYESAVEKGETVSAAEDGVEAVTDRKLIKTVSMNVETEKFDELTVKLEQRISELGGYIEAAEVRGNSYNSNSSRRSDMTIRVPSGKLDEFLDEVADISNITWKSENIEDITLNYVDVESRKKALEIEQERLLALLEIAESVEDIITIESRLSEVRYEMQSYASRLLVYDNQVDYSTIYLNIREVQRLTPQEEQGMLERIATGFMNNVGGAAELLENGIVTIIIIIPYLIVIAIVIVLIALVCRGLAKLTGKKRRERLARSKDDSARKKTSETEE